MSKPLDPVTVHIIAASQGADADPYSAHIFVRLLDFFSDTSPWQRRLWDTGTVLALRELDEASRWRERNVLSTSAVSWLADDIERLAGRDRGVGEKELRTQLRATLRSGVPHGSRHHRTLAQLTDLVQDGYIARWAVAVQGSSRPSPERLARAVASHLLDCGYSMGFLHRWVSGHVYGGHSLAELLDSAGALAHGSAHSFEVMVPFIALPKMELAQDLPQWRTAGQVNEWIQDKTKSPGGILTCGGFLYTVETRDTFGAADAVAETVDRLIARSGYTRKRTRGHKIPLPLGTVWVSSGTDTEKIELRREHGRGAFVLSLQAERRVYDVAEPTALDDALELAASLNFGSPGPAISGGWAAIEALLISSADGDDTRDRGSVAADRMAALVACSWPRGELTSLAHRHDPEEPDRLALALASAASNRERALLVAESLKSGRSLALTRPTDIAAQERMNQVVKDPRRTLNDVSKHITTAMRRLYRQRNLLMHGGSTNSVALQATLRTAAPLVGAGLDRITHAALTDGIGALSLASRAGLNLKLVGGTDGRHVADLLE
ncbi:integrase [Rhodococcus qingshengii]|uniref:Integrase n=5 Tax=Actinomycetes TaxID=1760 RepID=A0ABV5XQ51_9NOCA|nr:hypothetical protein [Rhodococcus qingshengii]EEN86036.1 hypothetical protein RHOER0001_4670 [Rhodococcus erythropolis SK121]MBP1053851.1 integrase [Rhodococcus qingshengii]